MKKDYNQFVEECWMGEFDLRNLPIATLGLVGEAGEVAEKIKKQLRGDINHNPMEHEDIIARNEDVAKELGDVLFYLTWLGNYHGYTIEQIMALNILTGNDVQVRCGVTVTTDEQVAESVLGSSQSRSGNRLWDFDSADHGLRHTHRGREVRP